MTDDGPTDRLPAAGQDRSFGHALKWSYVMDVGRQATTLLVTFVLAGVLGPAPYGTVAMAMVYVSFLQLLLAQGLLPAVIQRRDLRQEHANAAFWMVMVASVVMTLLTIPLSGWWAAFNDTPELGPVVMALSLVLPIEGLRVVQEGLMRRDMNMRPLAVRTNISVVAGAVVGVVLAFVLQNVWALVAQQLATAVLDVAILWRFSDWRPRLRFDRRAARDMLSFSVGSSVASLGVFVNNRADVLVTGAFFGQVAVGLYRFASRLVDTVIMVTVTSIQGAALPELSRYQHDRERFGERMVAVWRASALLALPVLGVLAGVADPLMAVLGPQWERAAGPLAVLCIMGAGRALTMLVGPMLQALGRTGQLAILSWLNAVMSAGAFVLAASALADAGIGRQVLAISWSRAALYGVVFLAMNLGIMLRVTSASVGTVVRSTAPSLLAGGGAALAGFASGASLDGVGDPIFRLGLAGGAGTLVAVVTLHYTDPTARAAWGRFLAQRGWGGFATAAHRPDVPRFLRRTFG